MRIHSIYVMLDDGRCIFTQSFTPDAPPKNLVTGMLTALQGFVREVTGSFPTFLAAGDFSFHFQKRGPLTLVLTTSHKEEELEILNQLSLRFMNQFAEKITNWKGNTKVFDAFQKDVREVLGPSKVAKRVDPEKVLSAFSLLELDVDLQDLAKGIIQLKEARARDLAELHDETEHLIRVKLEKLVNKGYLGRYEQDGEYFYFTD